MVNLWKNGEIDETLTVQCKGAQGGAVRDYGRPLHVAALGCLEAVFEITGSMNSDSSSKAPEFL